MADDLPGAVGNAFELFGQQRAVTEVGNSAVKRRIGTCEPTQLATSRAFRLARDVLVEFLKFLWTQPLTQDAPPRLRAGCDIRRPRARS
ncbi:MAG: hypothetical protein OXU19_14800 [bacterium]|nr:hypothetical protein [bacterium]